MTRSTVIVLAVVLMCGCNSAQPTFNPLAPYGSSRVPPPATNSLGANGAYYQNASPPRTAVPTIRANSGTASAATPPVVPSSPMAAGSWQPVGGPAPPVDSGVATASFNAPTTGTATAAPTATSGGLQLKGMPVNDATGLAAPGEPGHLAPPPQAAPIPTVTPTAAPAPIVTVTAKSSDTAPPAPSSDEQAPKPLDWR